MEEIQLSQEPPRKCGMDAGIPASSNGCFDCNICLDFAIDPVVTLCGHLYCWPCIYKWLQQAESISRQQCPVCKASISENTLVPLYGRGHSTKRPQETLEIPRRPSVHRGAIELLRSSSMNDEERYGDMYPPILGHQQRHYHLHQHELHHRHPYYSIPGSNPMPPSSPRVTGSTAGGVLGGMAVAVLPWMFRNQEAAGLYHSSSPYYTAGNGGSPRLRRQEMELERVLHQIWVFLFCCAMLCLLFF
ncbi:E3 ubiquitin-protein ligase RMA1H1 [Cocos nucifera]|uniref:E3 ubiquitin-protein ligase RMA n=1 Tax=Cocos nucifera TaxID=13894 RepID=A0A8K0IFI9_COCNU|nr:E3 ubiquitin-protein ligase RMA1H1 [Cocos nucifera]KAG1355127.1 E3 ubiquitin-protein ligase RMA1H1 [Cocos nucifera]